MGEPADQSSRAKWPEDGCSGGKYYRLHIHTPIAAYMFIK